MPETHLSIFLPHPNEQDKKSIQKQAIPHNVKEPQRTIFHLIQPSQAKRKTFFFDTYYIKRFSRFKKNKCNVSDIQPFPILPRQKETAPNCPKPIHQYFCPIQTDKTKNQYKSKPSLTMSKNRKEPIFHLTKPNKTKNILF